MPDPEVFADMPFPAFGLDLLTGYGFQRPGTTPVGQNVRYFESITQRGRGGSRPGLGKYLHEAVPVSNSFTSSTLIQHLNVIVDPKEIALLATIGDGPGSGGPPDALGPTAVLNPSGPDENGERTSGDDWLPQGGWGVQPRRTRPRSPSFSITVEVGIMVSAWFRATGDVTFPPADTTMGRIRVYINEILVVSVQGSNSWPYAPAGIINPPANDYLADVDSKTNLLAPSPRRIYHHNWYGLPYNATIARTPPQGFHDSDELLPGGTVSTIRLGQENTIRIEGDWTSQFGSGDPYPDCVRLLGQARVYKQEQQGNGQWVTVQEYTRVGGWGPLLLADLGTTQWKSGTLIADTVTGYPLSSTFTPTGAG